MASVRSRVLVGLVLVAGLRPVAAGVVLRGARTDPAWAHAIAELDRALADRDDLDPDVEVEVTPHGRGAVIVARRASGATAERQVDDPSELATTVLALVVVPVHAAETPVARETPVPREVPIIDLEVPPAPAVAVARAVAAPIARGRFGFGAALGARWQGGLGMRAAGYADATIGGWRIGANAAVTSGAGDEPVAVGAGPPIRAAYESFEVEAGVELGRRVELGSAELGAFIGPRLAKITRSFDAPMTSGASMIGLDVRDVHDVRLASSLRLKWGHASRIQMMIGLDASCELFASTGDAHAVAGSGALQPVQMTLPRCGAALTVGGEVAP